MSPRAQTQAAWLARGLAFSDSFSRLIVPKTLPQPCPEVERLCSTLGGTRRVVVMGTK